jgi:hypothetical protein
MQDAAIVHLPCCLVANYNGYRGSRKTFLSKSKAQLRGAWDAYHTTRAMMPLRPPGTGMLQQQTQSLNCLCGHGIACCLNVGLCDGLFIHLTPGCCPASALGAQVYICIYL